jgi:cytoskeletal protein CcmA (bactofilin family)
MSFFGSRRKPEVEDAPVSSEDELTPPLHTPQPTIRFDTVLGSGSAVEGELQSDGNIRLDGVFTGTLKITGNVLVGESARVNADLNARNISIAGTVRGNVSGNKIQLLRTCRVLGDISATLLTMEEGAFIDGKISMREQDTEEISEQAEEGDSAGESVAFDELIDQPFSDGEIEAVEGELVDEDGDVVRDGDVSTEEEEVKRDD